MSASVLLAAASYSDNNAIIEGLASSRCLVTIHNMGLALKRILRLNKNILFYHKSTLFKQKYYMFLFVLLDLEQDTENNDT